VIQCHSIPSPLSHVTREMLPPARSVIAAAAAAGP